ncbi:hypothetical protein PG994_010388 [Apiospora phragmitis]|uniref:Uncharacterized protein n=1 Tax=Apiospora phragmitis TaxID=2905665 RepID=A0ABR1TPS6_9PEZI
MSDTGPPSPSLGKPMRPEEDTSDEGTSADDVPTKDALAPPPLLSLTNDLEAEDLVSPMVPNFPPKDTKIEANGNGSAAEVAAVPRAGPAAPPSGSGPRGP